MQKVLYVGLDVHKLSMSVSVAEDGRDGAVRFIGDIPNTPTDLAKLCKRLGKDENALEFCYEAGCCGYGIYRHLTSLGYACAVVAPSRIPRQPGERIKTDRRDSQKLAILHRSGDLTAVWVPDVAHEAMRDLVRARADAARQLTCARQQLLGFLLRHGRNYHPPGKHWTKRHRTWLAMQAFELPAHQIVFQDYVEAVWATQERRDQLVKRITELLPAWSMAPLVEALRGLRGMDTLSAVTFAASVGDLTRFEHPRRLMSYLGLVPSERSSGERVARGGITKTGSTEARRTLIARLPKFVRDTAWNAQARLCSRYRRLVAKGKKPTVAITAIARELSGFIWAIGQEVKPALL